MPTSESGLCTFAEFQEFRENPMHRIAKEWETISFIERCFYIGIYFN